MNIQPYHWLVLGIVLMIAEMFVPTFFLLWFGAGAVLTALFSWLIPISAITSILLWIILSLIFCVAWFKFIQPKLKINRTKAGLGAAIIIGEVGMLTHTPNQNHTGIVRFSTPKAGASEWVCRSQDYTLSVGERVIVLDVVGNELLVGRY